jgi:FixJ family two-component response regulator
VLKQREMKPQAASKITKKDVQAIKDALQKAETATKAANYAARDQQRIEENLCPLTPRQKQVYLMLARGSKDREIAKALKIKERTVRWYGYAGSGKRCPTRQNAFLYQRQ